MTKQLTTQEAFRLGFVLKLAEEGISPSLAADILFTQKVAKGKGKGKGDGRPSGPNMGGFLNPATMIMGGGATIGLPMFGGSLVGGIAGNAMSQNLDTLSQARKAYLIKRYRHLIEQRKTKTDNQLLSESLRDNGDEDDLPEDEE